MEGSKPWIAPAWIWIFFLAGALWHHLGIFQSVEQRGVGVIVAIGAIYCFLVLWKSAPTRFPLWCLLIFMTGFSAELLGVHHGVPFGEYSYSEYLGPRLLSVPLSIGFAWVLVVLLGVGIARNGSPLLSALLVMLFDIVMEPAAIRLGLWSWKAEDIPIQNYLSWFGISFLLIWLGKVMRALPAGAPNTFLHLYVAQMVYFLLVALAR